jgi:hypothetical protein
MAFGPPVRIRFSEEYVSTLIHEAGFEVDNLKDAGKYHYILTAKPLP